MDVSATIEEAKQELASGSDKKAAQLLTDAAYRTHDPALEGEIRTLAEQGLAKAGFLGKGRWQEIIRIAELRGANGKG
ncbi:MAG: hypothetical protein U0R69_14950 [Gaiellales bacterium]